MSEATAAPVTAAAAPFVPNAPAQASQQSPTEQSRLQRRLAGKVPFSDVTVIVGRRNAAGERTEQMHNIDSRDFRITGFSEVVIEKMQKVKDDTGNLMGFEPTGEYELTIKVRYVNE